MRQQDPVGNNITNTFRYYRYEREQIPSERPLDEPFSRVRGDGPTASLWRLRIHQRRRKQNTRLRTRVVVHVAVVICVCALLFTRTRTHTRAYDILYHYYYYYFGQLASINIIVYQTKRSRSHAFIKCIIVTSHYYVCARRTWKNYGCRTLCRLHVRVLHGQTNFFFFFFVPYTLSVLFTGRKRATNE